jgi:hypothetical protein
MPDLLPDRSTTRILAGAYPYRTTFVVAESLVSLAGAAGAVQLITGMATPPVSDLAPLGLSSWVLPGIWLFGSVAVPSGAAALLAWRRSPATPTGVLVANGLLALEVAVQVPFVGPSPLQAIFGAVAIGLGGLAVHARRNGWRAACPR